MERRLTTILAADVVGYSRLMGEDEAGTMALLKARRKEVLEPLLAKHRGRVFKLMGDGVFVEFGSAVSAVECAIEVQAAMAAANATAPDGKAIWLRIGINLGDVMVEGGDLYGDGVNLAARLQEVAEPGGISLSAKVHAEIARKLDLGFEDLGEPHAQEHRRAGPRLSPEARRRRGGAARRRAAGRREAGDRRAALHQHERRAPSRISSPTA